MPRFTAAISSFTLLAFLHGCASTEEQVSQVMDESLDSTSTTYKDMATYPGNVTCGKYMDRDFEGFPVYKDFVVVDTEANLRPTPLDLAIYCSEDPIGALNAALNIDFESQRVQIQAVIQDFRMLAEPLSRYEDDNRHYPWTEQGLQALVEPSPFGNPSINFPEGGYIKSVPDDPWGNRYDYVCPPFAGIKVVYQLQSLGADGKAGGSGDNADIKHTYLPYFDRLSDL